eukprot:GHVS01013849.1.p2 GENE.GHVS01013849.1~~GHVS01013849.1.p2  ORF type:complete len:100 (+),score=10.96 GHVS01013849.1:173-472(+)
MKTVMSMSQYPSREVAHPRLNGVIEQDGEPINSLSIAPPNEQQPASTVGENNQPPPLGATNTETITTINAAMVAMQNMFRIPETNLPLLLTGYHESANT